MSGIVKRRLFFKFFTLCVLIICLALLSNDKAYTSFITSQGDSSAPAQSPNALIERQPSAPLLISSLVVDSNDTLEPTLDYSVVNVSRKPINAYAIRHIVWFGSMNSEGVTVRNSNSINAVLRPGQSEPASLEGEVYPEAVQTMKLVIDFVEFTDGTTWGTDKFKSAERLAGQRAGAQNVIDHLLSIKKDKGSAAMESTVIEGREDTIPSSARSPEWSNGFREGANFKRARLQRAQSQGGLAELESELQRPFDASARRQK